MHQKFIESNRSNDEDDINPYRGKKRDRDILLNLDLNKKYIFYDQVPYINDKKLRTDGYLKND